MISFGSYLNDYLKYEGISQSDFAFRLGITQKHLNEIINGKSNLSSDLMWSIAMLTGIDINFIAEIENRRNLEESLIKKFGNVENLRNYLKLYKIQEVKKREWIKFNDEYNIYQTAHDILKYIKYSSFDVVNKARDKIRFKENGNKIELLSLWLARCDYLAEKQEVKEYDKKNIGLIIKSINAYCFQHNKFDMDSITQILNDYGLYFVIENALPSTKVRGAFKVFKNKPAIYLTKYYQRLDGIVFALFHELGHVKSDFNQGKSKVIIEGDEAQEKRADDFACAAMISKNDYDSIKTNLDETSIKKISAEKKIPMCYIVSRLANDGIIAYNDKIYLDYIVRINAKE